MRSVHFQFPNEEHKIENEEMSFEEAKNGNKEEVVETPRLRKFLTLGRRHMRFRRRRRNGRPVDEEKRNDETYIFSADILTTNRWTD